MFPHSFQLLIMWCRVESCTDELVCVAAAADAVIVVPGRVKGEAGGSIQLLSSLFDQSVHIALDALCLMISRRDEVSDADANANHANVE